MCPVARRRQACRPAPGLPWWVMALLRAMITSMNDKAERLLAEALTLPASERAGLALAIFDSLEGTEDPAGAEEAWKNEIARRVEEIRSGKTHTVPWEQVKGELEAISDAKKGD